MILVILIWYEIFLYYTNSYASLSNPFINFHGLFTGDFVVHKLLILLLFLVPLQLHANDSEELAIDTALNAAYIQTGLKDTVQRIGDYLIPKTQLVTIAGYAGTLIYKKEVKFKHRQFLFNGTPNGGSITFTISF